MNIATVGGIPHMVPLIDFRSHEDMNAPTFIHQLLEYDWIIFTSKNGVDYFFHHIHNVVDIAQFKNSAVRFAVVGEKTKEALDRYNLDSRFMPSVYTAEDFAREYFTQDVQAKKYSYQREFSEQNDCGKFSCAWHCCS
ncbi:uroporphyrinogen-III synthase [Bacillus sp. N9]